MQLSTIKYTDKVTLTDHEVTGAAARRCRRRFMLSVKEVAVAAGLSPVYLAQLEAGDIVWTQPVLDAVTNAIYSQHNSSLPRKRFEHLSGQY